MLRGVAPPIRQITNIDRVGATVRSRRDHLGFAQHKVPGVSRAVVSNIERAKQTRYQVSKLVALGKGLALPADWIERSEDGEDLTDYTPTADAPAEGSNPPSIRQVVEVLDRLTEVVEALDAEVRRQFPFGQAQR